MPRLENSARGFCCTCLTFCPALAIRLLKDKDGNPIWNHANDMILGKPVYIDNHMPSAGAGAKPIAFGDFSFY